MSDNDEEEQPPEKPFYIERAKTGRAGCKKCKQKIGQNELRFAKLGANPFGTGTMKMWHHAKCIFEVFKRQRATTKKIETPDDIGGWYDISEEDREEFMTNFSPELKEVFASHSSTNDTATGTPSPKKAKLSPTKKAKTDENNTKKKKDDMISAEIVAKGCKDDTFRAFRKVCADVANESSYLEKTCIVEKFLTKGSDGESFKGDVELWCKLLLPGVVNKVYNLQSKQLVKIFSSILETDQDQMLEDLEKGDVAETISTFFEKSSAFSPSKKAVLTLQEVDSFLEELSKMTKEADQIHHFTKIIKKCTSNDLMMILRLIKHDLRINAGAKPILEALHPDAYKAFQTSRNLKTVVANALKAKGKNKSMTTEKGMSIGLSLMTPVLPMLAEACKSVEMALKKCPNGMYSEVKYDGERVQLHKEGSSFKYFSRSLKPVLAHKVAHFKDYIPQAFPYGKDLILDSEILMVDKAGKPLPFGTLGKHKKSEFSDANVCLFVFDCIYYNGESLINKPLKERKEILYKNMVEIQNHIMFSETEEVYKAEELEAMITKVFKLGLEGLVLKDTQSIYEPGKRHWLKVKKDYLFDGAMADTADLVVLGAWFGTGNKGGIMSSFLMGSFDPSTKKWTTVTKVHGGHDDKTFEKLQTELDVVKISKDASKVPKWLNCTKTMIPDFVAKNPEKMPVWEITGAEFTCNQVHTADGISIRFPRVTKIRKDKTWETATNLKELKVLYEKSKNTSDFSLPGRTETKETNGKSSKRKSVTGDEQNEQTSKKKAKKEEDSTESETEEEEEPKPSKDENLKLENALPDIFTSCVVQIPQALKDLDILRRYVVAYGGVLYRKDRNNAVENSNHKATHVIHSKNKIKEKAESDSSWSRNVRHVHINWLWDSIKLLERQDETKYKVMIQD